MVARATRARATLPDLSCLLRGQIVGAEMNAVGPCGESHVRAGVDEKSSCQLPVDSCQLLRFGDSVDCLTRQLLQFARRQVFLSKLDVVHAAAGGFGDFLEQLAAACRLVPGKCGAVSDVVEQQRLA